MTDEAGLTPLIRPVEADDGAAIAAIYNHYVEHTLVTFEEEPVGPAEMARRIGDVQAASLPWLVAEEAGRLAGYAYAAPWKNRRAYRFSVESTIYVDPAVCSRRIGSALYQRLLDELRAGGVHAVIAAIALPNPASVALHEKFGLVKVAHFRETGFKHERWVDVGYWQRLL